ncbi:MAG: pitrilysin family protein [Gemmatimonadaceae bacterium]
MPLGSLRTRVLGATALHLLVLPIALQAQEKAAAARRSPPTAAGVTRVTTVEGITEYRLANGLRVLLSPDASKPTATVNITYLVGSGAEGYGETGMAHLLEHLVYKGTPRHPNIPQELTAHGTRPNGQTSFDRTNYFETFAATPANLRWALDLEADRMIHSFIAKKDLDSEMTVVRNELESGENSQSFILLQRMLATAYLWHNYGHMPIGARSDIENAPIERLQAFYRRFYQPDNAILLVAGHIDEGATLALVQRTFGRIPRPRRVLDKLYTVDPTQDGERSVTLRRTGDDQIVSAMYHVPSGAHADFAAIDVLTRIMGEPPSGRLYKSLVDTKKAASVEAANLQLRDPGVIFFTAQLRKGDDADAARVAMLNTIDEAATRTVTETEVEQARSNLMKQFQLTLNDSERIGLELSDWMGMGDWRLFFLHRDRVKAVTVADVQRVAKAYLKPSNRTLGVFVPTPQPDRSEIPAGPDVAALVKGYTGQAAVATGEAFDARPAAIDARTVRSTLASGLHLVLLPKKTRGQTVNATLTLRYGTEQTLANRQTALAAVTGMLLRGTRSRSREQLRDALDQLKAQVHIDGGGAQQPNFTRVTIEATRAALPATLRLVGEVLRQPAFDSVEFAKLKAEELAQVESQRSEPQVVASIAFAQTMHARDKSHPRYVANIDESVAMLTALSVADVRTAYADFYGASVGELAIVGDFDAAAVGSLAAELFGTWKSPGPAAPVPVGYTRTTARTLSFETPDKANAFLIAGELLAVRDSDSDYPALLLANYILGGGFLNSRLSTRIRQKEGLSYGVASQLSASPLEPAGSFVAFAICAPENAARVETAMREEIARAVKDGFTADEVATAKQGYLQSRQLARSQDASLATQLSAATYLRRTMAFDADLEARIAAVRPEEIGHALGRHVHPDSLLLVRAGDFSKVRPAAGKPALPSSGTRKP